MQHRRVTEYDHIIDTKNNYRKACRNRKIIENNCRRLFIVQVTRTAPKWPALLFKSHYRWLHLSDFHLKGANKWSQDVVLKSLLDDISNRYPVPIQLILIFVTGDLAFSGKSEEYLL